MNAEIGLSAREAKVLRKLYAPPTETLIVEAEKKLRVLRNEAQALSDRLDDAMAAADKQAELLDLLREGRDTLERLP